MLTPFVLSGGSGVRLWPLSRSAFPKQFCRLLDESLLTKTLRRLRPLGEPWTVTTRELGMLTERVHRELGIPVENIVREPIGRNTAPAIALICRLMQLRGEGRAIAGVFPADHAIGRPDEFDRAVASAEACARDGLVVTLGIRPDRPATGFGYIEIDPDRTLRAAFGVRGFREKPDLETATEFVATGRFLWNAGIFIFEADRMASHFATFLPEIWATCAELRLDLGNLESLYAKMPSISVDYGIMEKLGEAQACVPCDLGWSDLGSWDDIAAFAEGSDVGALAGSSQTVAVDSGGSFVFSSMKKVYALVGAEDMILVDTPDALLAVKRGCSQRVREVVDLAAQAKPGIEKQHPFELRPWGGFTVLCDETHYKSKHLFVEPGAQISYQSHVRRAEHWIVVAGTGEVTLDGRAIAVGTGSSVFIPIGAKHRVRCTGPENLEIIEVQTGSYFGEDDITRYQDDYGRA